MQPRKGKKKDIDKEEEEEEEVSGEEEEEEQNFDKKPDMLDKYLAAAKISQEAMKFVINLCVPNALIAEVCIKGDKKIEEELSKIYNNKKKKTEKGIAFPVCVSPNEFCGHYAPMPEESLLLKIGDVVKIDLGCHIDVYIAQISHTFVIGASPTNKVTGKKAEVVLAARKAFEAILRYVKENNLNNDCTKIIKHVADTYKCKPVEGVLSHRVKKHIIDCNETILNCETHDQKVKDHKFEKHEVYVIDIVMSSGEGKPKDSELRSTIFKRAYENTYLLKLKGAQKFFHIVNQKYPTLPFSISGFEDLTSAKIGVKECCQHELFHEYPVLKEKENEIVAQFKATLAIMKHGSMVLNYFPFDENCYESNIKIINPDLLKLLESSIEYKKPAKVKPAKVEEVKKDQKKEEQEDKKEVNPIVEDKKEEKK